MDIMGDLELDIQEVLQVAVELVQLVVMVALAQV